MIRTKQAHRRWASAAAAGLGAVALGGCSLLQHVGYRAPAESQPQVVAQGETHPIIQMTAAALSRGDAATAVTLASSAVDALPNDPAARLMLGQAHLAAGQFATADAAFAAVPAGSAQAISADIGRAIAQLGSGQVDAARAQLARIRAARVTRTGDLGNLGLALALVGEAQAAVGVLEQAVARSDVTPRVRLNLALAYSLAGERARAMETAAIDLDGVTAVSEVARWSELTTAAAPVRLAAVMGLPMPQVPTPRVQVVQAAADDRTGLPDALEAPEPTAPILVAVLDTPMIAPRQGRPEGTATPAPQPAAAEAARPASPGRTRVAGAPAPVMQAALAPVVPVAVATPTVAAAGAATTAGAAAWSLQIGATRSEATAEAMRQTLLRQHGAVLSGFGSITARPVAGSPPVVRLFVGRFASQSEAGQACGQLRAAGLDCLPRRSTPSAGADRAI